MLINLRNALMAGKRTPTAKDYVQDGLIAMWDGIENAGWGVHDPNATIWVDLAGNLDLTFPGAGSKPATWGDVCATRITYSRFVSNFAETQVADMASSCIEVVVDFRWYNNDSYPVAICGGLQGHIIGIMNGTQGNSILFGGYATQKGVPLGDVTKFSAAVNFSGSGNASVGDYYFNGRRYDVNSLVSVNTDWNSISPYYAVLGGRRFSSNDQGFSGSIFCVRKYSRALTADEIARNYAIDKARFGLP